MGNTQNTSIEELKDQLLGIILLTLEKDKVLSNENSQILTLEELSDFYHSEIYISSYHNKLYSIFESNKLDDLIYRKKLIEKYLNEHILNDPIKTKDLLEKVYQNILFSKLSLREAMV